MKLFADAPGGQHVYLGPKQTDWRVLIENATTPVFPRNAINEGVLTIFGELFE